jgi:hypothetical protein
VGAVVCSKPIGRNYEFIDVTYMVGTEFIDVTYMVGTVSLLMLHI